MKTLKNIVVVLIVTLLAVSCVRDYEAPPFTEPIYKGATNNITIAQFKKLFASATATPTTIDSALILKVRVAGNDVAGNIYKQIYVQDETGGIVVSVDQSDMYTSYRVGQELFLDLKGLSVLTYGGELQIGFKGTNANRIPWDTFIAHAYLNSWPDTTKVAPKKVDLGNLTDSLKNTVIQLDSVYFVNEGKGQFAVASSGSAVSQSLKDKNGASIDVRTSLFADFAADSLPTGFGTLVGVLGKFNGTWQFTIRSRKDIQNFSGEKVVFLDESLTTQDSFGKFTPVTVVGDQIWGFNPKYGALITGFSGGNNANEDWLISPVLDLTKKKVATLTFSQASGPGANTFIGKDAGFYTVWVTNNYVSGAPSTATWTQLDGLTYTTTPWSSLTAKLVIPAVNLKPNFRFAFKYMSSASQSATWQIKNVSIK